MQLDVGMNVNEANVVIRARLDGLIRGELSSVQFQLSLRRERLNQVDANSLNR